MTKVQIRRWLNRALDEYPFPLDALVLPLLPLVFLVVVANFGLPFVGAVVSLLLFLFHFFFIVLAYAGEHHSARRVVENVLVLLMMFAPIILIEWL